MALEIGNSAPALNLKDKDGKQHKLADLLGAYTLIFFYPKDNTPGCILEAKSFSSAKKKFDELSCQVVGISGGDEQSKTKFCEKNHLSLLLLSDPDFSVSKKYQVFGPKKFMGRSYEGISRVSYLLDSKGKIIHVFDNVKPANHCSEVLDLLKSLK